jgi:hypothetical protein
MPARRDDSGEASSHGLLGMDMHVLRVEAARELDDLLLRDNDAAEFVDSIRLVIFKIALFARHGELRETHPSVILR